MGSRSRFATSLAALALVSCSSRPTTFVPRTWPADHTVVVILAGDSGAPIDDGVLTFAPEEVIHFELEPRAPVRVHVATYGPDVRAPDGRSLVECGATFEGSGPLLPTPSTRWVSRLVTLEETPELTLEEETGSPAPHLRFARCEIDPCAGYSATRLDAPAGLRTRAVAAIDDTRAIFGGTSAEGSKVLYAVDGTSGHVVGGTEWITSYVRDLVFDREDAVWAVLDGGARFRLNVEGSDPTPYGRGVHLDRMWIGTDGVMIGLDHDAGAWELTKTSTLATPRRDFPLDVHEIAVMRRERMFMRDAGAVYFFDGARWTKEHETPAVENVSAIGGDEDVMAVVGALEVIRVRDEATHIFELFARPFDMGTRLRGVAGLGGGRFLVAGERGSLAVWTGAEWCPFEPLVDVALVRISVAPSKRVAYVAGDNEDDPRGRPVAIRVDVPPP